MNVIWHITIDETSSHTRTLLKRAPFISSHSLSLSRTHAHPRTCTRTHPHTRTLIHALSLFLFLSLSCSTAHMIVVGEKSFRTKHFFLAKKKKENFLMLPNRLNFKEIKNLLLNVGIKRRLNFSATWGSGCSTAVERTPHNIEVVGSNPAGCWAFFSSLSSQ